MKRIFAILSAVLLTASAFAQTPQKMSYQAVIRNSSDALVTNTQVGMKISILQGSATGTIVYTETQTPFINANGLLSIEIGGGEGFSAINWANDIYFIKTETDPTGGSNYTITGTSQLLSVPYALYAKTAESITGTITETDPSFTTSQAANITSTDIINLGNLSGINAGDQDLSGLATKTALADSTAQIRSEIPIVPSGTDIGDMQYWNGIAWVLVPKGTVGQLLSVNATGIPEWQNPSSLKSASTQVPTMTATGVTFNGVVNTNGLSTTVAFEYGTDLTYGTIVTATQSPVTVTTNTAITSAVITSFTVGTTYHVRLITQNIFGTFYGDDITFTYLYYGASYAGGFVFSFDNIGLHGLVCAPSNQSNGSNWADAFTACAGYNGGGFNDWILPSKSILNLMYVNLKTQGLGGFVSDYYWSSSESSSSTAWMQTFNDGWQYGTSYKGNAGFVRAVRAF